MKDRNISGGLIKGGIRDDEIPAILSPAKSITGRKGWTKGPWAVHPNHARVDSFDEFGDVVPLCAMLWPTKFRTEDETEANARLIAQSPRLYDALEALVLAIKAGDAKEETLAVIDAMQVMKDARGE